MSSGSSGWYWWANPIRLYSWVAGELPVEAGHTDQDQAEIASVEEVPELFQPSGSQAVSLIDDHQLCVALGFFVVELGVVSRVERAFDVVAQAVDMEPDFQVQPTGRDRELRGIHDRELRGIHQCPAVHQRRGHGERAAVPVGEPVLVIVGGSVGAR